MRTNIVIDDALMAEAMRRSGSKTKRETVERALRLLVRLERQAEARALRGQLEWSGDLKRSRAER